MRIFVFSLKGIISLIIILSILSCVSGQKKIVIKKMDVDCIPPKKIEKAQEKRFEQTQEQNKKKDIEIKEVRNNIGQKKEYLKKSNKPSNQKILDMALDLCQTANELWNRGEIDSALDTLDQAYSLIIKIDTDDPDIIQQRDDLRITIARRIVEIYSSKFTTATGNGKEIPLTMNKYVKQAIKIFQTKEKKFFIQAYKRSGRYRPMILRELKKAGLPAELSWLPLIESGFSVRALSRARALGLWQFIASTGYKFGLKRTTWVDERMDPEKSTKAAIAYLKELHQIFGEWTTALAAYNCGEERVLRCIRSQKINYLDDFWDLYALLPQETAFYVPKFLAVLHIVNNPEEYGFELPPVDKPIDTDKVMVDKQVHLSIVAKYIGVPYKLLKGLNPELRRNCTPPDEPYPLKVPSGKGELLLSKLKDIPEWHPRIPSYVKHRVRRGESLYVLARRYHTSIRAIANLNSLRSNRFIRAGQILKIPVGRKRIYRPASSNIVYTEKGLRYRVKGGDSLWKIARRFGVTIHEIMILNKMRTPALKIGQVIYIPSNMPYITKKKVRLKSYRVKKGDTPYEIAKRFGMKLSLFLKVNNLKRNSPIFPGQIVMVNAK